MDHETGRSRGTGFACFWNKEDADKVLEQSEILRAETTGNTATVGLVVFSSRSTLNAGRCSPRRIRLSSRLSLLPTLLRQ